jgi:hypothetical protein
MISFLLEPIVSILIVASIAVFVLSLRIAFFNGYQKGIAKGRDITIAAYEKEFNIHGRTFSRELYEYVGAKGRNS